MTWCEARVQNGSVTPSSLTATTRLRSAGSEFKEHLDAGADSRLQVFRSWEPDFGEVPLDRVATTFAPIVTHL